MVFYIQFIYLIMSCLTCSAPAATAEKFTSVENAFKNPNRKRRPFARLLLSPSSSVALSASRARRAVSTRLLKGSRTSWLSTVDAKAIVREKDGWPLRAVKASPRSKARSALVAVVKAVGNI